MANLKELRTRISTVKTTKQITSAMKMVAAARLKKAQDSILAFRPYAYRVHLLLSNLLSTVQEEKYENLFFTTKNVEKVLIIAITSNRGLCGAFNSNVEKRVFLAVEENIALGIKPENIFIYAIGKKGFDSFRRKKLNIYKHDIDIYNKLEYSYILKITEELMNEFVVGTFDRIDIIYNSFKNAASQEVITEKFLPVEMPPETKDKSIYIFEPNIHSLTDAIIPQAVTTQLFKTILDSFASEQGARMTAMHKATDNAMEILKQLNLSYNKARQAAITNEILEIVGGAEALKG